MGKSKKKRRVRVSKLPVKSPLGRTPAVWSGPNPELVKGVSAEPTAARGSVMEALLRNNGEALFQLVALFPLLLGVWASGGLYLQEFNAFSLVLGVLFCAQYLELAARRRVHLPFFEQTYVIFYAAIVGFVVAFYYVTESKEAFLVLCLLSGLFLAATRLELNSTRAIVLQALSQIAGMGLLAILGVYCQSKEIFLVPAVLGLIPGSLLAAVIIAKNAKMLESLGWTRADARVERKTNLPVERPGLVTKLYSLFLILGPALPAMLLPYDVLPDSLLLSLIPLYFMPVFATGFLRREVTDEIIAIETLKLALLATLCVLIGIQIPWIGP